MSELQDLLETQKYGHQYFVPRVGYKVLVWSVWGFFVCMLLLFLFVFLRKFQVKKDPYKIRVPYLIQTTF